MESPRLLKNLVAAATLVVAVLLCGCPSEEPAKPSDSKPKQETPAPQAEKAKPAAENKALESQERPLVPGPTGDARTEPVYPSPHRPPRPKRPRASRPYPWGAT